MIDYRFDDGGRSDAGFQGGTGDCLVRAIAIATGRPYREVYNEVASRMKAAGYSRSGNARTAKHKRGMRKPNLVQEDIMRSFGFEKVKRSGTRLTYSEAHAQYGTCIVRTTRHVAALKDGALRDTFDGRTYEFGAEGRGTAESGIMRTETRERKAASIWIRKGGTDMR